MKNFIQSSLMIWSSITMLIFSQDRTSVGYIKLTSDRVPRTIFLDGERREFFNNDIIKLYAGKHTIAARRDLNLMTDQYDFLRHIDVGRDDTVFVRIHFENAITVQTTVPTSASVFINDSLLGTTPFVFTLAKGEQPKIRVSKNGYVDTTVTVYSSNAPIAFTLKPQSNEKKSLNDNDFVNERWRKLGIHKNKNWLIISCLATIAAGYYTVINKKTADDAFEKAKLARRSGDTALSQKLTAKTRRHDDRARIGFIGMQFSAAGFATLLLLSR